MQRRTMLLVLVTVFACSKSSVDNGPAKHELRSLTVDEVAARLAANDGKTFIYDNNLKESWVAAHVPSAKWLDDESITAADLPANKSATLIFYCHNET